MGCAMRIARSLGLHLSQPSTLTLSPTAAEQRELLWWSLFELETVLCLTLGRIPSLALDACTAALPGEMVASITRYRGQADTNMLQQSKPSRHIPPGYLIFSARLCRLSGRVLETVQHEINLSVSDSRESTLVLKDLKAYRDTLPLYLRPECPTAPSFERAICYLDMRYQMQVIILTRKCLLSPTLHDQDQASFSSTACVEANKASIEILKRLHGKGALSRVNYIDAYCLLVDAMILIIRAAKSPSSEMLLELESFAPLLSVIESYYLSKCCLESLSALCQIMRNTQQVEQYGFSSRPPKRAKLCTVN